MLLVLGSCRLPKVLNKGEYLLDGNRVQIVGEAAGNKAELLSGLELNFRQKPNRKLLGLVKFHLTVYRLGTMFKKTNKFSIFLTNKVGERPVILDSLLCDATVKMMKQHLQNQGYLQAEAGYTVRPFAVKRLLRNAVVTYHVASGPVYTMDSIDYKSADTAIQRLLETDRPNRMLITGQPFAASTLINERQRLHLYFKNSGYYQFVPSFVSYEWDSTGHKIQLKVLVATPPERVSHTAFSFAKVLVEIDSTGRNLNRHDTLMLGQTYFVSNGYRIDGDVLQKAINLQPGNMYSQQQVEETYRELVQLGIFKFVNIKTEQQDSNKLICHVRLTPQVKQEVSVEPTLQLADQPASNVTLQPRNYGISLVTGYTNNNMLGKADIFKLRLRNSLEFQFREDTITHKNNVYISSENNLSGTLELPGLRMPFGLARHNSNLYNRTLLSASLIYEINNDFDRRLAVVSFGYRWNHGNSFYALYPAEMSFIKTDNLSQTLKAYLLTPAGAVLSNLFGKNFIAGSRFVYNYSNQTSRKDRGYFVLKSTPVEVAGNLLDLAYTAFNNSKPHNERTIFGVKYFQYVKTDWDVRYNQPFIRRMIAVFRLNAACGLPFGNSSIMPYEKRYFSGGSVSLRGWRPRTLGPGGFNDVNNPLNRTGEFKLEGNVELRFPVYKKVLEGAVFTDAGNIWNIRKDSLLPGAEINAARMKDEIAIDGGIGIRLNLPFFMIRADGAVQLRDPGQPAGSRWVASANLHSLSTIRQAMNISFGIGYPF